MAASNVDWNLLRVFLALMRANTLREAAAALGTSHPTVRRKLHALETQLGVVLFERAQQGLRARLRGYLRWQSLLKRASTRWPARRAAFPRKSQVRSG